MKTKESKIAETASLMLCCLAVGSTSVVFVDSWFERIVGDPLWMAALVALMSAYSRMFFEIWKDAFGEKRIEDRKGEFGKRMTVFWTCMGGLVVGLAFGIVVQ